MSLPDVESRLTCEDLMVRSYRLVDEGHASRVTELFTRDGLFTVEGTVEVAGRDSLAEFFAVREADKARRTRHCLSNFSWSQVAANELRGRATLMLFVLGDVGTVRPAGLADVADRYVVEGARWRIAERITTPL